MRICSGKFERGMEAFHAVVEGKNIKLATGTQLMADRAIVDEQPRRRHHRPVRPASSIEDFVHWQKEGPVRRHPHLLAGALCPH